MAKFGKTWKTLSPQQKQQAKDKKLLDTAFEICRHIYPGNAPFTPDTVEYMTLNGVAKRLDKLVQKFKIAQVQKLIPPGSSLAEIADDFLYNNRTGDDDTISFSLK